MSRLFVFWSKGVMKRETVLFKWLDEKAAQDIALPQYETSDSAGMDVRISIEDDYLLQPGEITLFSTGFAVAIPSGFEIQVRPRSGLAIKHGITLINSPGTIDADYRGEVKIGVINLGKEPYCFKRGERVAQMILAPVIQAVFSVVDSLDETERGVGGFGHTGTA